MYVDQLDVYHSYHTYCIYIPANTYTFILSNPSLLITILSHIHTCFRSYACFLGCHYKHRMVLLLIHMNRQGHEKSDQSLKNQPLCHA